MAEDIKDDDILFVSGKVLKELKKRAQIKGTDGEIIVQNKGKDTFIGWGATQTIAAIVDGVAGFYTVPARLDEEAGTEAQAKQKIIEALGIDPLADFEEFPCEINTVSGGVLIPQVVTLLRKKSSS